VDHKVAVGTNGLLHIVKCKVSSKVKGKDKLFALNWDSFGKHPSYKKT
jgi:hypothetical protein